MRKFALLAALAALVVAAFGAASASADILPTGTTVTGTSTNATLKAGTGHITCNSGIMFTTPSVASWPNPEVALTGDTSANVRFGPTSTCTGGATVHSSSGWQISATEIGDISSADDSATSTVTVTAPGGTTISVPFPQCNITITSNATGDGTYTDNTTTLSVQAGNLVFDATGSGCSALGIPSSGTNATFSATYTTDMDLTVT